MQVPTVRKLTSLFGVVAASLMLTAAPVFARGGGGGHAGGFGGGFHGGAGFHGGYGGFHGGYGGFHGGYGGYRGGFGRGYGGYGYRGYGGWGGWGWGGLGLGLGLYFATLPYYYSTYYWGGVPYYYADDTYYRWDGGANQYETVAPPDGLANQVSAQSGQASSGTAGTMPELMVYPKNGQSQDQIGKDKYDCHKWASSQTGFDPTQAGGTAPNHRSDYMRAQAACLEGRGYSVK